MRVRFHGAAGEVTGSMHLVEAAGRRVLLDCGLVQGNPEAEARNAHAFPFDVGAIDAVVASHAHIDHVGRIPLLAKRGYTGPIFATEATAALMPIMLLDSAGLAEADAERANRYRRAGEPMKVPLYTRADVEAALARLRPLPYDAPTTIAPGIEIVLREAGHIIGSAVVELRADGRTLCFSGDLGPRGAPILRDPATIAGADLVLMESTYGDREHRGRGDTVQELGEIFHAAWRDRGNVLIPAFAVGRTQELLYWFARHWEDWELSRWRIFLDSPMAARVSAVYQQFQRLFDERARETWRGEPHPFRLPNLRYTATAKESMAINRLESGAIVIAGSGMCNGGRIVHHLRQNLGRREAHVVFIGYQAEGTLGRRLVDGARWVRIHGRDYRVNAVRHTVGGLSAHAGQSDLLDWYGAITGHPPVALVHGEDRAREALAGEIHERFGTRAVLVRPGDVLEA
jgi:metallo-beta-lactamase family protein